MDGFVACPNQPKGARAVRLPCWCKTSACACVCVCVYVRVWVCVCVCVLGLILCVRFVLRGGGGGFFGQC